jgi:hypothetical protein
MVAVLLGPVSTPAAITSSNVPAEPTIEEVADGIPTMVFDVAVAVDAANVGGTSSAPGTLQRSRSPAPRAQLVSVHADCDRSPPLA